MINEKITNTVNIIYYELFDDSHNPVIATVARGISGELFSVMMWRPVVQNMRNFHHWYSDFLYI